MINNNVHLLHGNCLDVMKGVLDNSIDSIVTDPPYELGFMGKKWDSTGIAYNADVWKECLRVLKPGGHLLAFGGTRTQHRMVCAIEDAGFEIRDQIQWLYGSGFPKSMNIGKAVKAYLETGGSAPVNLRKSRMGDKYKPTGQEDYRKGRMFSSEIEHDDTPEHIDNDWEGWGTCLKPAHEPICLARKPLGEKTVAENVLKWGTGGLNIDESRIPVDPMVDNIGKTTNRGKRQSNTWEEGSGFKNEDNDIAGVRVEGRFPANIILDEVAGTILDEQGGTNRGAAAPASGPSAGKLGVKGILWSAKGEGFSDGSKAKFYNDKGGASRFFYCPKASKSERGDGNSHPTVKPIKLIEYLVTLVTPESGMVLDPFMGSGTTALACINLGNPFIGIELSKDYLDIAKRRVHEKKGA